MKLKLIMPFALLVMFNSTASFADNGVSFGAGLGSLYSGLGVNVALRSDSQFGYVAAGCLGVMSSASGWIVPCGIGAGWLWTDLLSKANNRHGIGLYAGPTEYRYNKTRYGLGATYEYFLDGVNSNGWNFGTTLAGRRENGKARATLFINTGYQF